MTVAAEKTIAEKLRIIKPEDVIKVNPEKVRQVMQTYGPWTRPIPTLKYIRPQPVAAADVISKSDD